MAATCIHWNTRIRSIAISPTQLQNHHIHVRSFSLQCTLYYVHCNVDFDHIVSQVYIYLPKLSTRSNHSFSIFLCHCILQLYILITTMSHLIRLQGSCYPFAKSPLLNFKWIWLQFRIWKHILPSCWRIALDAYMYSTCTLNFGYNSVSSEFNNHTHIFFCNEYHNFVYPVPQFGCSLYTIIRY